MSRLALLLIFVLLSFPVPADTILVLGDSISAGYGIQPEKGWVKLLAQRLEQQYPGQYQVINASISGDTTDQGLTRLPGLLASHEPDQVVVELGGNDGLRGLPLTRMRNNLESIIELCRRRGAEVILVSVNLPPSYGIRFNRLFDQVFESLSTDHQVPRVALGFEQVLNDRNLIQDDGVHPTEAAQPLLLEAVWPYLKPPG